MFERNVVDRNTDQDRKQHHVALRLASGGEIAGYINAVPTRTLEDELNAPGPFVDFEPHVGERAYLAKSSIVAIREVEVVDARQLDHTTRRVNDSDPYRILGVARGTSSEKLRAAYHRLTKIYHPDRFSGLTLPTEITKYVADMSMRINTAYQLVQAAEEEAAEAAAHRARASEQGLTPFEEFRRHAAPRYQGEHTAAVQPEQPAG